MRSADYTTGKWLELGLGLRLGSGLGLWFRLGFCQHPHVYCLPTVRSVTPQFAFTVVHWLNTISILIIYWVISRQREMSQYVMSMVIVFNANKSKCLVAAHKGRRHLLTYGSICLF